jgi:hypothetical protein
MTEKVTFWLSHPQARINAGNYAQHAPDNQ